MSDPTQAKLPFKCKEDITEWEILAFDNEDRFNDEVGSLQYYFVLSVNLIDVEKVKKTKKKEGGFCNLGKVSPAAKSAPKVKGCT